MRLFVKRFIFLSLFGGICVNLYDFYVEMGHLRNQMQNVQVSNKLIYNSIQDKLEDAGLDSFDYSFQLIESVESAIVDSNGSGAISEAVWRFYQKHPNMAPEDLAKIHDIIVDDFELYEMNHLGLRELAKVYKGKIRGITTYPLAAFLGLHHYDVHRYVSVLNTEDDWAVI